jgi:hypothetical protein
MQDACGQEACAQNAYAIVQRWAHIFNDQVFNDDGTSAIAALYAPDATIWGTLAQVITITPQAITDYFIAAARAGLSVKLGDHVTTRVSDACIVDAGHYEFTRTVGGKVSIIPARYSFTLIKSETAWLIAHQHSSVMPKPL